MKVTCPICEREIPPANVNVEKDTGYCQTCKELFRLSALNGANALDATREEDAEVLRRMPPPGLEVIHRDREIIVMSRNKRTMLLFLVPFASVWAGGSMYAIYGTQIIKGHFELMPSLFGIPFLLGSCGLVFLILTILLGRSTLRICDGGILLESTYVRYPKLKDLPDGFWDGLEARESRRLVKRRWSWRQLKAVAIWTNGERMAVDGSSTLVLPAVPKECLRYMLAMVREAARQKHISLDTIEYN